MRIGILAPVWFAVPPVGYGGIERVVHLLAEGLVAAGHEVTLFASGDSRTSARLEPVFDVAPSEWIGHTFWELRHAVGSLGRAGGLDVVHDHTGLLGLALGGLLPVPLVHTVHGPLDGAPGELYEDVCRLAPSVRVVAISANQQSQRPGLPWLALVPNALDVDSYPFDPGDDGYLLYLGRLSPEKGAHRAIEVAERAGLPLRLAGKCREPAERAYFEANVAPRLSRSIEYLGEVSEVDRIALLRRARATLFPIDWEEPFGLVMIESLACGTPVLATRRGSVPEVIRDGVTGIVVDDHLQMVEALERAARLEPAALRRDVEERFAPQRMVRDYAAAYEAAVAERRVSHRERAGAAPA